MMAFSTVQLQSQEHLPGLARESTCYTVSETRPALIAADTQPSKTGPL